VRAVRVKRGRSTSRRSSRRSRKSEKYDGGHSCCWEGLLLQNGHIVGSVGLSQPAPDIDEVLGMFSSSVLDPKIVDDRLKMTGRHSCLKRLGMCSSWWAGIHAWRGKEERVHRWRGGQLGEDRTCLRGFQHTGRCSPFVLCKFGEVVGFDDVLRGGYSCTRNSGTSTWAC
jgi:hypothetical protein